MAETVVTGEILDRLVESRIFSVKRMGDEFAFDEECDGYFRLKLTRAEVSQLIDELEAMLPAPETKG